MNTTIRAVFKRLANQFTEKSENSTEKFCKNFLMKYIQILDVSQIENSIFNIYPVKLHAHAYILLI